MSSTVSEINCLSKVIHLKKANGIPELAVTLSRRSGLTVGSSLQTAAAQSALSVGQKGKEYIARETGSNIFMAPYNPCCDSFLSPMSCFIHFLSLELGYASVCQRQPEVWNCFCANRN